jgi:hypothetical protein
MHLRKMVLPAALFALAVPAAASAATGSISATAKTAHFTGTITEPTSLYDFVGFFNEGTEVQGNDTCTAPFCEVHTLTVADGAAEIRLDATSDAYNLDLELVAPDGTKKEYNSSDSTAEQHDVLDPQAGNWTVRVYGAPDLDSFDYDVQFTFRTPEDVANDPQPEGDDS